MRLSNVSFRYGRRAPAVIRHADASLAPGDVVELTGVNGAGKSTLLRLLAGLVRPTAGTVTGRPAVVGFAPDRFPVDQPFTVAGYLRHMARIRGGAPWEPWLDRLAVRHLLGMRLGELSKGSAHKVGLAQALMADPGLLVLDEPFAGLDEDTGAALPSIVADLAARGAIVVVSDHQGGLRGLPGLRHWSLAGGRLGAVVLATRAPLGQEAASLPDGAVLVVPVLAWAARSLLDTEPDQQRAMSAVAVGGRPREVAAGLLAALAACAAFAALALGWGLLLGLSAAPPPEVLAAATILYGLSALSGTVLGALTSRAILPSPAVSIMTLVLGYLAMLLVSASPLSWLTVPVVPWMRAASDGALAARLPLLAAVSLAWCLIGLTAYGWLRRTRP
ncbi:ATP-binding cassette domain-containing protein [Thermoactinospora rubra]|uniref:ATP-binding cassette domain-containing protein n=1 Tax=Thermoactinospora rubra TaxID=1088767 RepID=UPI000A1161DA|nr:ATP-binding cassette domain-containing protein [Thermoactinospora rubra]